MPSSSLLKFLAARSASSSDDGCRAVVGDRGTQLDCGKGVGTSGRGKETGNHQVIWKDHAGDLLTEQGLFSVARMTPPCQGGGWLLSVFSPSLTAPAAGSYVVPQAPLRASPHPHSSI